MGLEAHSSPARLQGARPTVKSLADRPDDAAEWAGHTRRKPDGKALRMAALQRAISHPDADTRAAALFTTLEADAKGASSQARSAALADLARLRSCAGSLASAWLTARPGPAELTAVEFCSSARLCLGEDLIAGQDGDDACVCGSAMAGGRTHSLICGALWHTVVARHNAFTEAWLRIAALRGNAAARELHDSSRSCPAEWAPSPPQPLDCALHWSHDGAREPCRLQPPPYPRLGCASTLHSTQAHTLPVTYLSLLPRQRHSPLETQPVPGTPQLALPAQPQQQPRSSWVVPRTPQGCCRSPLQRRHRYDKAPAAHPARSLARRPSPVPPGVRAKANALCARPETLYIT